MRYILNDEGYIETVSFTYEVECNNKTCTEYTGSVPTGYETLAEWDENANINAYKIVDGNLTYDSAKDTELQTLWAKQQATGEGTILYENESGTNATTIPMSETLANYKNVEVVYGFENIRKIVKSPKGVSISLFLSRMGYFDNSYYGVRQSTTDLSFNNANAIKQIGYTFTYKTDGTMVFSDALNEVYIYKIVGYKS